MKKFLVTALVLGMSSAAFAAPGDYTHASPPSPELHDHGFRRPMPMPEWTILSSNQRLMGSEMIRVRSQQAFSKLELQAVKGSTFVDKVIVKFENGRSRTIELDKRVALGSPLVIDLPGRLRKITKLTIVGKSGRRSAINVMAV